MNKLKVKAGGEMAEALDDLVLSDDPASIPAGQSQALDTLVPREAPSLMTELPADVRKGRSDIQAERVRQTDSLYDLTNQRLEADRARAVKALEATGIQAGELQPWDHEKQSAKYRTNPLDSFGSLGSVFAMVAAAFTRAPMENALNGAAAAMNAIKEGDDKEFDRAFTAWKENTNLTLKRHTLMQQDYTNAMSLMSSDMTASRAQMQMLAAKYDDKQVSLLMEHGMDKEAFELLDKRNRAMLDAAKAGQEITKARIQQDMLERDPAFNNPSIDAYEQAAHRLEAFNRIYGVKQTPQQEIMGRWMYEHPRGTAEEAAEFYSKNFGYGAKPMNAEQAAVEQIKRDLESGLIDEDEARKRYALIQKGKGGQGGAVEQEIQRRKAEYIQQGLDETAADTRAREDVKRSSSAANVSPQNVEYQRRIEEKMAANPNLSRSEAENQVKTEIARSKQPISANRADDLKERFDKAKMSFGLMNKAEDLMRKHNGLPGAFGYAGRAYESVSNIFGSNETDRVQFARYIAELQSLSTQILTRAGRPLAAEADKINLIVAGLRMGDTTANTNRAFAELKQLYAEVQRGLQSRIESTWTPEGTPAPAGNTDWWKGLKDRPKE